MNNNERKRNQKTAIVIANNADYPLDGLALGLAHKGARHFEGAAEDEHLDAGVCRVEREAEGVDDLAEVKHELSALLGELVVEVRGVVGEPAVEDEPAAVARAKGLGRDKGQLARCNAGPDEVLARGELADHLVAQEAVDDARDGDEHFPAAAKVRVFGEDEVAKLAVALQQPVALLEKPLRCNVGSRPINRGEPARDKSRAPGTRGGARDAADLDPTRPRENCPCAANIVPAQTATRDHQIHGAREIARRQPRALQHLLIRWVHKVKCLTKQNKTSTKKNGKMEKRKKSNPHFLFSQVKIEN